jgi:hypothetical protein
VLNLSQEILRTDISGMPLEWIDYRDAVRLQHMEQIAYTCGSRLYTLMGGTNAKTGHRTIVDVNSIIATLGHSHNPGNLRGDYIPPLNNQTLFRRDAHLCLYCGERFPSNQLSRDHIRPLSQGGRDTWMNVVTACAVYAYVCGVHLPERPSRIGRSNGISGGALSTQQSAACTFEISSGVAARETVLRRL